MKHMILGLLVMSLMMAMESAQANEYIHGTVTLKNGETHTGVLRWDDDEETFWTDHFNGEKSEVPQYKNLSDDVKEQIEDAQVGPKVNIMSFQVTLSSIFAEDIENPDFILPFAAIKKLTRISNEHGDTGLRVLLHNSDEFESFHGSNDLDAEVFVKKANGEMGQYKMRQIDNIVFSSNEMAITGFNQGIHAVVESEMGTIKGRVFWDRDERFLNETIEGTEVAKPENGELSIPFSDILSIEKKENSALIIKHDESELLLSGTNDVNDENRGLYIDTPDKGRILLPWTQFKKMTLLTQTENDWQIYHRKSQSNGLLSAVVTKKDGSTIQASNMVFNMAQTSPAEMVRCTIKGMDYYMPLFLIKSIEPLNGQQSQVVLMNGETLSAYDASSFTEENLGLIYKENGQSHYLQWTELKKIEFNH